MARIVAVVEKKDKRDYYLAEGLERDGFIVVDFGKERYFEGFDKIYIRSINGELDEDTARSMEDGSVLFSRGLSAGVAAVVKEKNIRHINILEDETFIVKNAYLTAEGALSYIIQNTDATIRQMPVLVLGYGRVGKSVTKLLKDNYSFVSVATDDPAEYAIASIFSDCVYSIKGAKDNIGNYAAIINTVPKLILEGETLKKIDTKCFILDLASKPGGVDFKRAKELNLNYMHALGVPGKIAPKTAGLYIKDIVVKHIL